MRVTYSGLPGDKYYELAQKYLPKGTCGVISIVIKGGKAAAVKFMDGLKLASNEVARGGYPHLRAASRQCHSPIS